MNSIPQAVKSQINPAGKIAFSVGSSGTPPPTFTMKQISTKAGTVGPTPTIVSNSGSSPAAFIKINHPTAAPGANQPTTQVNTAAKIQIQQGVSSGGNTPAFSMTVPHLNSTPTGVKRKADEMENHTN